MNFSDFCFKQGVSEGLGSVLNDLSLGVKRIEGLFSGGVSGYADSENAFGEQQVKMDVVSNEVLVEILKENVAVGLIGSEELAEPMKKHVSGEAYAVVFDPLDGSSVVDANMAVGTVMGVYEGVELVGKTGRDQVAAVLAVYGPQTILFLALQNGVLAEFVLDKSSGELVLVSDKVKIGNEGKYFAPGDLNSALSDNWYHEALHYWLKNGYKLRYSGSMAADVSHILKKGGGLFLYPGSSKNPRGKLRLLYECAPVALLMENAGGSASNGEVPILDVEIDSLDQREPLLIGSRDEVRRVEEFLKVD